jgi:hypothetical protein
MYHGKPYDPSDSSNIEEYLYDVSIHWAITLINVSAGGWYAIYIMNLLRVLGFCNTSGDIKNALSWNSVRVDWKIITDPKFRVNLTKEWVLVELGKKKAKRVIL